MTFRGLLVLAAIAVLYGCDHTSSPIERQDKNAGAERVAGERDSRQDEASPSASEIAEGVPPYEVAFATPSKVKGMEATNLTVDTPATGRAALETVGWDVVRRFGPGTEQGYRFIFFTFRDSETYEEEDIGVYVADEEAMSAYNDVVPDEMEGDTGQIPEHGVLQVAGLSEITTPSE